MSDNSGQIFFLFLILLNVFNTYTVIKKKLLNWRKCVLNVRAMNSPGDDKSQFCCKTNKQKKRYESITVANDNKLFCCVDKTKTREAECGLYPPCFDFRNYCYCHNRIFLELSACFEMLTFYSVHKNKK